MTTVKELIEQLNKLDPSTRVMLRGYEGGYYDFRTVYIKKVELDVNKEWYYGPHEEADQYPSTGKNQTVLAAIIS